MRHPTCHTVMRICKPEEAAAHDSVLGASEGPAAIAADHERREPKPAPGRHHPRRRSRAGLPSDTGRFRSWRGRKSARAAKDTEPGFPGLTWHVQVRDLMFDRPERRSEARHTPASSPAWAGQQSRASCAPCSTAPAFSSRKHSVAYLLPIGPAPTMIARWPTHSPAPIGPGASCPPNDVRFDRATHRGRQSCR